MKRNSPSLTPVPKTKHLKMVNLKVVVLDTDFYSLQAINSYLAWDRRTRVNYLTETPEDLLKMLRKSAHAELPDVIALDADHLGGPETLLNYLRQLHEKAPKAMLVCLSQTVDEALIEASVRGGARAFMLKGEVKMQIAWAIVYAMETEFLVTKSVKTVGERVFSRHYKTVSVLPDLRMYPELTDRVRQAMELCVIKGMPAQLAADEMGISLHTVRSYIKDGYRILEAYDEMEYPVDMSPQERAFMRLTAFKNDHDME